MIIIDAKERGSVDISLTELIHHGGELKIRPDLINRGLIELRQSSNKIHLKINGVIGRIPVTDGICLDVQPKFPISNLNRIVYVSFTKIENPFFINRPYSRTKLSSYLPVPIIKSFTRSLNIAITEGMHRDYTFEIVEGNLTSKINLIKSDQRFWSKLVLNKAVLERFSFSIDNIANQTLKLAAHKALCLSKTISLLNECVPYLADSLRQLEYVQLKDSNNIFSELRHVHTSIPSFRADYAHALSHAVEILRNTDVSINVSKEGMSLESYIISLDDAYERYLRHVLHTFNHPLHGTITCVDGNDIKHQKPLFKDNKKYKVKPDMIFKSKSGTLLISDAKYKFEPSEEDRYQVICHALTHSAKKAVLIYPKTEKNSLHGLVRIGLIGNNENEIEVFEYYFDLSSDLLEEENLIRQSFEKLMR